MMNEERKMTDAYEAPQVEVIEVEIEKGFAASLNSQDGVFGGGSQGGHNMPG